MKYLCLAYGAEKDWLGLTKKEQEELLAQDKVIRDKGNFMSAVEPTVTTVTAWHGSPDTTNSSFAKSNAPLAGFSIVEAANLEEVIKLVADTPCARANGAIEIRPLLQADG